MFYSLNMLVLLFCHLRLMSCYLAWRIYADKQHKTYLHWIGYDTVFRTYSPKLCCVNIKCLILFSGFLIRLSRFPLIYIKIINCFPSPCTRLSPARTTMEAPLPYRIFKSKLYSLTAISVFKTKSFSWRNNYYLWWTVRMRRSRLFLRLLRLCCN